MSNEEELAKRIYYLEEKHNEYTRQDLARLSRYSVTSISVIVAVIAFLVTNNKDDLLKYPNVLYLSIYIAVVTLALAIVLEFVNSYLFGNLTEASKDIELAKFKKDSEREKVSRSRRDLYALAVDYSRFLTLIVSSIGIISFMFFAINILRNILSS